MKKVYEIDGSVADAASFGHLYFSPRASNYSENFERISIEILGLI